MPKISDSNLYGVGDLIRIWEQGWGELANFAEELGFERTDGSSSDNSRCQSWRVLSCSEEIIRHITRDTGIITLPLYSVQALTAAPDNKYTSRSLMDHLPHPYEYGSSRVNNRRKLRKILKKTTKAFATNKTLGGVLQEIATPNNYKRFIKEHHLDEYRSTPLEKLLGIRIEPPWTGVMRWLGKGLRSKEACEEAWWNCVWLIMQPKVGEMLEIKRRIHKDIPLTEGHISLLNEHMNYGHPIGSYFIQDNGSKTYQVVLRPHSYKRDIPRMPLYDAAYILLVQPTFELARELQSKLSRPRFIRQCRAPSCGKRFYTGWKDATSCPSTQSGKKSTCQLEWVRYRRWLEKTHRDPETDWDEQEVKKLFLER